MRRSHTHSDATAWDCNLLNDLVWVDNVSCLYRDLAFLSCIKVIFEVLAGIHAILVVGVPQATTHFRLIQECFHVIGEAATRNVFRINCGKGAGTHLNLGRVEAAIQAGDCLSIKLEA